MQRADVEAPGDAYSLVAWRPNGRSFVVAAGKRLALQPVPSGRRIDLPEQERSTYALAFSERGDRFATGGERGVVRVWDASTGALAGELAGYPPEDVRALAFSHDGKLLAATGAVTVVWRLDTRAKVCATEERFSYDLAFTRDGGSLVTTNAGAMTKWDAGTCAKRLEGSADTGGTFGSWVAPDGEHVAAAAPSGHGVTLLDGRTFAALEVLASVQECRAHVGYTGFSRDGQILLAYGGTRWFRSFRVASRKTIAAYDVPNPDDADDLVPFDDGERLIVARGARIELVSGPSKSVAWTADRDGANTFAISWDMKQIVGVSADGATLWDAATGKPARLPLR